METKTPNPVPARLSNPIITINGTAHMETLGENGLVRFTSVTGITSWVSVEDLFWY